jgi:cysteinyl-tRNA synthetase
LVINGEKMSKSLGNLITVQDVVKKGYDPLSLRYLFFQTHYRQEMNFTWEALDGARTALNKLRDYLLGFEGEGSILNNYWEDFLNAVNEDMNMPKALSVAWEMMKSEGLDSDKKKTLLEFDKVLGFNLLEYKPQEKEMPENIKKLLKKREVLRSEKKYEEADKIREEILKMGFRVEDKL